MGPTMVIHKIDEHDSKQKRLLSFSPDYNLGLGYGLQSTPSPARNLDGEVGVEGEDGLHDLNSLGSGGEIDGKGNSLPQFGGKMLLLHGGQISEIGGARDDTGKSN